MARHRELATALPDASIGHIGLFRNAAALRPQCDYLNLPSNLAQADVFVVDPVLATGISAPESHLAPCTGIIGA